MPAECLILSFAFATSSREPYYKTTKFHETLTRTHPNQSQDTLISLIILSNIRQSAAFPALHLGISEVPWNLEQKFIFQIGTLIPTLSKNAFIQLVFLLFLVTMFSLIA